MESKDLKTGVMWDMTGIFSFVYIFPLPLMVWWHTAQRYEDIDRFVQHLSLLQLDSIHVCEEPQTNESQAATSPTQHTTHPQSTQLLSSSFPSMPSGLRRVRRRSSAPLSLTPGTRHTEAAKVHSTSHPHCPHPPRTVYARSRVCVNARSCVCVCVCVSLDRQKCNMRCEEAPSVQHRNRPA